MSTCSRIFYLIMNQTGDLECKGILFSIHLVILKNILNGFIFEEDDREHESVLIEKFISSYYVDCLEPVNLVVQYDVNDELLSLNENILSIKKPVNEKQKNLVLLNFCACSILSALRSCANKLGFFPI